MIQLFGLLLFIIISPSVQHPASNDVATVYLYRVEEAPKLDSGKPKVYMNGSHVFSMPESEFIGLKLASGEYVFRMQNKASETPIKVEAGKVYYIRVSEVVTFGYKRDLFVMTPEQAIYQMRDLKPLEDKNIKDRSLTTSKERPMLTPARQHT